MKQMTVDLEKRLRGIAILCSRGFITWDEKEELMDIALEGAGWTREDLRAYNREREKRGA